MINELVTVMRETTTTARRAMGGTLFVAFATMLVVPATAAAAPPFVFTVYIGSQCVYGTGPANDGLTLSLIDRDGVVISRRGVTSDGAGNFSMSNCFIRSIVPLDHVRASDGSVSREFVVPLMSIAIDRVADIVSGRAPANSVVSFSGCHYLDYLNCHSINATASTASNGTYSKDLTAAVDLRGQDYVYVRWYSPSGDFVQRQGNAPKLIVSVGSAGVFGQTVPGHGVQVALRTSSSVLKGQGSDVSDWYSGYWSTTFRDANGAPVYPRSGNTVSGTYAVDSKVKIPATSVTGTASNDHVTGRCLAGRPMVVYSRRPDFSSYSYAYGSTNATGHFDVDMSNPSYPSYDLHSHDQVEVSCLTAKGDTVAFRGVVP